MTELPDRPDVPTFLSEDAAHRFLARAVELDSRHASDVPLSKLREIAREAGISDRAFELALEEIRVSPSLSAADVQGASEQSGRWSRWQPVIRNVGSFAAAMVLIGTVNRFTNALGATWPVGHAASILANVLGAGLALRLRGRMAAFVLGVTAIAQLAEYPMHLVFGIATVQGGPTKWALILAATLGLGAGVLSRRREQMRSGLPTVSDAKAEIDETASDRTTDSQPRTLMLRLT